MIFAKQGHLVIQLEQARVENVVREHLVIQEHQNVFHVREDGINIIMAHQNVLFV